MVDSLNHQWFGTRSAPRDPCIVLLHEGLGSVSTWGAFPAALAESTGLPVLAYDRRGYGLSTAHPPPWPPNFMELEAVQLTDVLRTEGITQPILVGHSDGGTIALLYPSRNADSRGDGKSGGPAPLGIVALAAHLFVEPVCVAAIETMRRDQTETFHRILAPHHDDPAAVFEGWSEVWVSQRFRQWSIDDQLGAVKCPVLAFQGLDDQYATRAQLERIEAAVSGPIELVDVPNCDHWPHREATTDVLARISAFCAALSD
ncbi:MAG: pimeloyl-ACP methyl ester carboxylesterase [Acidimicrobiales bacterium]|jgi:pimeloyl-ACP methyl ester carboxylesterase